MRYTEEANTLFNSEEAGPRVKAPALLIYGEGDPLRRGEPRAREGIPGCIIKVFPGVPGAAHSSRPAEFGQLAVDFLAGRTIDA
jgi:pimeloyl-ACP methyl ester carboxylesterase